MAQLIRRGSQPQFIDPTPDPLLPGQSGSSGGTPTIGGGSGSGSPFFGNSSSGQYQFSSGSSVLNSHSSYDTITGNFGLLGSLFGDVISQAQALSLRDIYGNTGRIGTGFGSNSNVGVNAFVDFELSAKQATVGNPLYYRKLGQDLVSPNSAAAQLGYTVGLTALAQRNPTANALVNAANRAAATAGSLSSTTTSYSIGTFVPSAKANPIVDNLLSRYSSASIKSPITTKTSITPTSGLVPNQSNFAVQVYRPQERLAPIGNGGKFSSGTISIRPSAYNTSFYKRWGL